MRRGLQKNILAGLMSFALVVPSSGIFALADSQKVSAEEDKNTVLTKILGAEDISLRMKWAWALTLEMPWKQSIL